jgi:hypothetical protein
MIVPDISALLSKITVSWTSLDWSRCAPYQIEIIRVRPLLLARYARLNQKAEDENENDDEDDWGRKRERVPAPAAERLGPIISPVAHSETTAFL